MKKPIIAVSTLIILSVVFIAFKLHAQDHPDAAQAKIQQLETQLQQDKEVIAQLSADAARGRHLPVSIKIRKALTGDGYVIVIQNESTRTMPVKITLTSPTFNKTKDYPLVLDGAHIMPSPKEIGYKQGWAAAPGDVVHIESQGFDTFDATVTAP